MTATPDQPHADHDTTTGQDEAYEFPPGGDGDADDRDTDGTDADRTDGTAR